MRRFMKRRGAPLGPPDTHDHDLDACPSDQEARSPAGGRAGRCVPPCCQDGMTSALRSRGAPLSATGSANSQKGRYPRPHTGRAPLQKPGCLRTVQMAGLDSQELSSQY